MSSVLFEIDNNAVARITINRPDSRNALSSEVMVELTQAFEKVRHDSKIRCVILSGAGDRAFCAGGDIKAGAQEKGTSGKNPYTIAPGAEHPLVRLFRVVADIPVPVIARVNGHAMGGGFGLVCMADLAIVSRNAKLGSPEAKIGLFPMVILAHMLRLVPIRQLYEMAFTGRAWSADEALAKGVVNQVVNTPDDLDAAVDQLVGTMLENSPTALRVGKKTLKALEYMDFEQRLEHAQLVISQLSQTEDAREGMSAFVEKRKPVWTGK